MSILINSENKFIKTMEKNVYVIFFLRLNNRNKIYLLYSFLGSFKYKKQSRKKYSIIIYERYMLYHIITPASHF